LVEKADLSMVRFVARPAGVGGGRVAKKRSAAQGTAHPRATLPTDLVWAWAALAGSQRRWPGGGEERQFSRRQVEPMIGDAEVTAGSAAPARAADLRNLGVGEGVYPLERRQEAAVQSALLDRLAQGRRRKAGFTGGWLCVSFRSHRRSGFRHG
jgi:hypothetical protein